MMRRRELLLQIVILLVGAFTLPAARAQAQVTDEARAAFQRMAATLESASSFSVQASVAYDVVQPTGQKLQFHGASTVRLQRPDRLHALTLREGTERELWIRAGQLFLHDRREETWGTLEGPEDLDGMLDMIARRYGLSMPLADLLYSEIDEELLGTALSGMHVGRAEVEGVSCDQLAFVHPRVDWQIWIEAGERALPRKVVITYKNEAGQPQYQADLWAWTLEPRFPPSVFEFAPPPGSERVTIAPLDVPRPPAGGRHDRGGPP